MKRLTTVLLAVVLTTASFSAAPALAVGLGQPVITSPTEHTTYVQGQATSFSVDFSEALPGTYSLVVTESQESTQESTEAYDEPYDPVVQGDQAFFSLTLSPGTYAFAVRDALRNDTDSVNFSVEKPVTKPSKPLGFHSARGNHKVRVGWAAPSSNGGARITGFQVKRYRAVRNVSAGTRAKTFTGLKNGRKYNFYVRAKNRAGWSRWAHTTGTPKAPKPAPKPKEYKNCTALHKVYPHGVGKPGAVDHGGSVTNFYPSTALYNKNTKSDRDKDGIACEQA